MLERKIGPKKEGKDIHTGFQPLQIIFFLFCFKFTASQSKNAPHRAETDAVLTWSRRSLRKEGSSEEDDDDGDECCTDLHYGWRWVARAKAGPGQILLVSGARCCSVLDFYRHGGQISRSDFKTNPWSFQDVTELMSWHLCLRNAEKKKGKQQI